jgi:hypothetical protein
MKIKRNKFESELSDFIAKLDADHAAEFAPYRFKIVLGFGKPLSLSTVQARGSWVTWYLQSSHIGGRHQQLRFGLEGIALCDATTSEKASEITIYLKDHPCFKSAKMPAEAYLRNLVLRAISLGTNVFADQDVFATLDELSDGAIQDLELFRSHAQRQRVSRVSWGTLR